MSLVLGPPKFCCAMCLFVLGHVKGVHQLYKVSHQLDIKI
uniref:Uncharacterized protein n=1 Tax=Rhizophora mucronata TaxID=61149 RepID=A0A2P2NIX6_RHIMU